MPSNAPTLLGLKTSQLLEVLSVGVDLNTVNDAHSSNFNNAGDKKVALRAKHPKVFQSLGKLKGYQLKLHIDAHASNQ